MNLELMGILDAKCNRLSKRLDELKAAKRDKSTDAEYMATLYDLREATRKRLEGYAPTWVTPQLVAKGVTP